MKNIIVIVLTAIIAAGLAGGGVYFWQSNIHQKIISEIITESQEVKKILEKNITLEKENKELKKTSRLSSLWNIQLPEDELLATNKLQKEKYIYATKVENDVEIYEKNIIDGSKNKIFEYKDSIGECPLGLPGVALSHGKGMIAYQDNEGLKIYNLTQKTKESLIKGVPTDEKYVEVRTIVWSIEEMNEREIYSITRPQWSTNGRYLSFSQSHYEGSSLGLLDTSMGNYFAPKGEFNRGIGSNITWSPVSDYFMVTGSGYVPDSGLYVISPENFKTEIESIDFEKAEAPIGESHFSNNGNKIVFTYSETEWDIFDGENSNIAIIDTDGKNFEIIKSNGSYFMPIFTPDNKRIIYIKKEGDSLILSSYDLINKADTDIALLPKEFNNFWSGSWFSAWEYLSWTEEGYLVVSINNSSPAFRAPAQCHSSRMFIIDIDNQKLIYVSPKLDYFTTFAGFINN